MKALTRSFALLLAVALVGCGGDELPPPEGFLLNIRLVSIDPDVVSNLNVNIAPQGPDEAFMALPGPLTFNEDGQLQSDGPFTYDVADDGVLEIDVLGAHVNDRAVDNGDNSHTFTMQMWSAVLDCNEDGTDCTATQEGRGRMRPQITVIVDRGAEALGDQIDFLPSWPLDFDSSLDIAVECRADAVMRCTP